MINLNSKIFLIMAIVSFENTSVASSNAFDSFGIGALGKTTGFTWRRARFVCGERRAYYRKALVLKKEIVLFEGRASCLLYSLGETKYRCNGAGCGKYFETGRRQVDGKDGYEAFHRHMRCCEKETIDYYQKRFN